MAHESVAVDLGNHIAFIVFAVAVSSYYPEHHGVSAWNDIDTMVMHAHSLQGRLSHVHVTVIYVSCVELH